MKEYIIVLVLLVAGNINGQKQFSKIYGFGNQEIARDVGYYNGKYYMGFYSDIDFSKPCSEYIINQVPEHDLDNNNANIYSIDTACLVLTASRQTMILDSKGNIYVAGQRASIGGIFGVLVRIKNNGQLDWFRDISSKYYGNVFAITLINDNKVMVVVNGSEKSLWDGTEENLIWYDSLGNITKKVKTDPKDWVGNTYQQIHPMGDTAYIISSEVNTLVKPSCCESRLGLRCIDTAGIEKWRRTDYYGDNNMTGISAPVKGNRILAAYCHDSTHVPEYPVDPTHIMIGVYDASTGTKLWEKYDTSFYRHGCKRGGSFMIPLKNGDALIIGYRFTHADASLDPKTKRGNSGWIARLNPDGEFLWQRVISDTLNTTYQGNSLYDGIELENGDILLGGECNNKAPKAGTDAWLLRLDSMGCFTPGCKDELIMIGNQTVSTNEVKQREVFFSVQKNPIQDELVVNFYQKLHRYGTELILMDMSGKELEHYQIEDGTNQASFRTGHLASGSYVLTLRTPQLNLQTQLIMKQ